MCGPNLVGNQKREEKTIMYILIYYAKLSNLFFFFGWKQV